MSQLSSTVSLPRLAYKGIPVVTTETLALAYEVDAVSIRKNFSCNKGRFTEGKHYFSITGKELSAFRLSVTESNSQISPKVRALTLWTERGAARHAKMLNSDKAWDMFELLEETFFRVAGKQIQEALELTPADRSDLKALVDAKLSTCPAHLQGKARSELWARFNRHFRIAEYAQLPPEKMAEARDYIITLELRALSAVETRKAPALPKVKASNIHTDLSELKAVQSKLDLLLHTVPLHGLRGYSTGDDRAERELVLSRNAHIRTATNCLVIAKMAIEAAMA
ncbi:ORF6N domain-containing protein [Mailhella sp.]|uniref:ORF6N domain-containing protein n=1 Tax=Mailhella sp. TaxID=1981029 RepID=UPI003AB49523